jgi:outer membrane protein TolC
MSVSALSCELAQNALLPTRTLTASAGLWGINALLNLPLFDGGRREAGEQGAAAQLVAAAAGYSEQVLIAFRDVKDQLSALQYLAVQSQVQAQAVQSPSRRKCGRRNIRRRWA